MSFSNGPTIVTNGLVLSLDTADNNSYPGSGTTWKDLSGNGNNGILIDGPTYNSSNGGSILFDGSNDYVNCSGTTTNVSLGSIEVWTKIATLGDAAARVMVGRTNTAAGTFNILKSIDDKIIFRFRITNDTQYEAISNNVATTQWSHYVGTYNGTIGLIYVNTQLQTTQVSVSGVLNTSGTLIFNIGRNTNGSAYFNGNISIVKIYNRALSASEVLQNYNAQKSRFGL
jgi:hypothetical protein